MRVFDFVGVKEAVDEVRDGLEERRAAVSKMETQKESETVVEGKEPEIERERLKRTVVADSEDEASDEDEDEDMLFDSNDTPILETTHPAPTPDLDHQQQHPLSSHPKLSHTDETTTKSQRQTKLLLINNLTQVLNPLLKKDYISGIYHTPPFHQPKRTNLTLKHPQHTP
ncbi:hypothetical protein T440DRAFT_115456 [Plenodomus tracheiphilus IPT5]|uniref:Uncharacterized protein n=1 Tax=Plenodomus tracheiphilus IPT5 TaxID=1408161 RepID=A0A6A7B3Q6_9PLEO|nr:hypothetical protein T440DRAFT_115456 [Plenodomus tracheiphilus IPT5]